MPLTEAIKNKKISISQVINLVILIVGCLIAINIFKGQNKKIAQIRQATEEQKEKNETLLNIGDLKKRINLYKQRFKPKDRREIINTITDLAAASKVEVVSIRPVDRRRRKRMISEIFDKTLYNLAIQIEGYHQLGEFISKLENNPIMFIIESLQVKRSSDTKAGMVSPSVKLEVELVISELFFKE
jgi:Tfp pilus assembly protein PilO